MVRSSGPETLSSSVKPPGEPAACPRTAQHLQQTLAADKVPLTVHAVNDPANHEVLAYIYNALATLGFHGTLGTLNQELDSARQYASALATLQLAQKAAATDAFPAETAEKRQLPEPFEDPSGGTATVGGEAEKPKSEASAESVPSTSGAVDTDEPAEPAEQAGEGELSKLSEQMKALCDDLRQARVDEPQEAPAPAAEVAPPAAAAPAWEAAESGGGRQYECDFVRVPSTAPESELWGGQALSHRLAECRPRFEAGAGLTASQHLRAEQAGACFVRPPVSLIPEPAVPAQAEEAAEAPKEDAAVEEEKKEGGEEPKVEEKEEEAKGDDAKGEEEGEATKVQAEEEKKEEAKEEATEGVVEGKTSAEDVEVDVEEVSIQELASARQPEQEEASGTQGTPVSASQGTPVEERQRERPKGRFAAFQLQVVYEEGRTGFEEHKDYPLRIGERIAGRYEIVEYLGSAAFSRAVQCLDIQTQGYVCVKVIKNNKEFFDQSLDEIKLLHYINGNGDADDNCVLQLYDYFYHKEHLFLVSELLRDNLYEFSKYNRETGGPLYFTVQRLQRVAKQVLTGLAFIHDLGLMHCDLKPENILIKSFSRCEVKVIDFGSSCYTTDHLSSYIQSRCYRAPEVILGCKYGQNIDIWSLGAILPELFTGQVIFHNDSVPTMLATITAVLGPMPGHVLNDARHAAKFLTRGGVWYEATEDGSGIDLLFPKPTTVRRMMNDCSDDLFVDFVCRLLELDHKKRPSAREALEHPWLKVDYGPLPTGC